MIEQALALEFGREGNAANHLGGGWSTGEAGFRWMTGDSSDLWLENPGATGITLLEFDLRPFVRPPELPAQRLVLQVRGVEIGRVELTSGGLLGWRVPSALLAGPGPVRVTLQHPDARRPSDLSDSSDDRSLAVSVHAARLLRLPLEPSRPSAVTEPDTTGGWTFWSAGLPMTAGSPARSPTSSAMPAADLVMCFESLGDNCEFGLVQRKCGKEPLGLLRFANIMLPSLLRGMSSGFAGLGDLDTLKLWDDAEGKEYVIRDMDYGITYHTFLYKDQVTEAGLVARQSARLKFLARKLVDDVDAGEKIFIVKRNEPLSEAEILPLFVAMRARSNVNLLWVTPADEHHAAGTVERVLPGLLRGWIDRFAPYENAPDLSLPVWLELCRQAHNLTFGGDIRAVSLPVEPGTTATPATAPVAPDWTAGATKPATVATLSD